MSNSLTTCKRQLIWIPQCLYPNQTNVVRKSGRDSKMFDILFGVRHGCVLSPRLFGAALELAMSEWGVANPQGGMDLGNDMLSFTPCAF